MNRRNGVLVLLGAAVGRLVLGLFTEWRHEPFVADASLGYSMSHIHHFQPITLVMIATGTLIASYVPLRRGRDARRNEPSAEARPAASPKSNSGMNHG